MSAGDPLDFSKLQVLSEGMLSPAQPIRIASAWWSRLSKCFTDEFSQGHWPNCLARGFAKQGEGLGTSNL